MNKRSKSQPIMPSPSAAGATSCREQAQGAAPRSGYALSNGDWSKCRQTKLTEPFQKTSTENLRLERLCSAAGCATGCVRSRRKVLQPHADNKSGGSRGQELTRRVGFLPPDAPRVGATFARRASRGIYDATADDAEIDPHWQCCRFRRGATLLWPSYMFIGSRAKVSSLPDNSTLS